MGDGDGDQRGAAEPAGVRQWWEAAARGQVTPAFADLMESTSPGPAFGWAAGLGCVPFAEALAQAGPGEGRT